MDEQTEALEAIRKKLLGKSLTYSEIFAVMDEIAKKRMGEVLTTYFAASGYAKGFSNEELFYLTKAMVATGEHLSFPGIVADKHSIGGVPGTRTTLIVIPIIAAAGFLIPKSSSRAITTPDGTADDMEVLSPVTFNKAEIYDIVKKAGACIVWGGGVDIAPADDMLIQVEKPLMFESFDKVVVSIMAKKIAFGSNHVVIDIPYGESVKVHSKKAAEELAEKFSFVASKFMVKLAPYIHQTDEPAGRGIGPVLECREALRVLEQTPDRPLDLEEKALDLCGMLLDLCLPDAPENLQTKVKTEFGTGRQWAKSLLATGKAHEKMQTIISAQGGDPKITSTHLVPAIHSYSAKSEKSGMVTKINSKNATIIAKILGAPMQKRSGIYLDKKIGEKTVKGDSLYTLYSQTQHNLTEATDSLTHFPLFTIE